MDCEYLLTQKAVAPDTSSREQIFRELLTHSKRYSEALVYIACVGNNTVCNSGHGECWDLSSDNLVEELDSI